MKNRDLVVKHKAAGCLLARHGGLHDIYRNPLTGRIEAVPRHKEVNELLARKIYVRSQMNKTFASSVVLHPVQFGVEAVLREEFGLGAEFRDTAVFDDGDAVAFGDC